MTPMCKCGFKVTGEPGYDEAVHIIHCAFHKAALDMYNALVTLSKGNRSPGVLAIAREALRKAEGGRYA